MAGGEPAQGFLLEDCKFKHSFFSTAAAGLSWLAQMVKRPRQLSQLCLKLTAIDGSPTALAEAQRRHGHIQGLNFLRASLPAEMSKGPFDLIVVSEIAYYLRSHDLARLARNLPYALAPGGRVIVLDTGAAFQMPPNIRDWRIRCSARSCGEACAE
jgi:SAM-dependent methyltransferase